MLTTVLLAAVLAATPPEVQLFIPPVATEDEMVSAMVAAAKELVAVLPPEELKAATFSFAGKEHKFWHYIPTALMSDSSPVGNAYKPYGRFGVPVEKMSPEAITRLHRLLRTALSIDGYQRFAHIMRTEGPAEPMLATRTLNRSPTSTPAGGQGYCFFSLFGAIGTGDWGWRFEGHHFSLSMEVSGGHVRFSPVMVGYNPWPQVPTSNLEAVKLFNALSKDQQAAAQVVKTSPDDGIPKDIDRSPKTMPVVGALLGSLSSEGQYAYNRLLDEFIGSFPDAVVGELRKKLQAESAKASLAWYGTFDHAKPYFIRLQGPSFLIQMRHNGLEASGAVHGHLSFHDLEFGSATSGRP